MRYLTYDDVLDLHTFAIERWGGRLGIRSQDQLLSALHAPQQILFGEEVYASLTGKAAVLSFQLLKNRPFVDGNEATALLVLLRFLAINNASLGDTAPPTIAQMLEAVLHSNIDRDGLTHWLDEHIQMDNPSGRV